MVPLVGDIGISHVANRSSPGLDFKGHILHSVVYEPEVHFARGLAR